MTSTFSHKLWNIIQKWSKVIYYSMKEKNGDRWQSFWGFCENVRFGVPWVQQTYFYQNFCPWYVCLNAGLERESYLTDFHQIWNKQMNYSSRPINHEKVVVWNVLRINPILAQKLMEIDFNFVRKLYQSFCSNLGQISLSISYKMVLNTSL